MDASVQGAEEAGHRGHQGGGGSDRRSSEMSPSFWGKPLTLERVLAGSCCSEALLLCLLRNSNPSRRE